jgi:hypothetical protein
MPDDRPDPLPLQSPLGQLERALIDEFVRQRGYDPAHLGAVPERERAELLKQASLHASARMAEVESRSHYLDEVQLSYPRG